MAGETRVTVVGNLTADPELRYTASGAPVADFTVAATPRAFDRATGEWKDADPLFLRCSIWRQPAENLANSLSKGARVVVEGVLRQRSFETKDGEKRTVIELDADEVGASLRYATVQVHHRIRWHHERPQHQPPGGPRPAWRSGRDPTRNRRGATGCCRWLCPF